MGTIQPKVGEPLTEELQLVQAAKGGDVSAFEDLVKRYPNSGEAQLARERLGGAQRR